MGDQKSKSVTVIERTPVQANAPAISYSFEQVHRMAVAFAKSNLYGIKDENQALALMLEAQAQGKHPALIMRDYDMIGNRLAKKSTAMLRDFQASGGRVEWVELTDTRAAAKFSHPLAPVPILIDWDVERAKKAGLASKEGSMYIKYTRAMLRSRCISEGVRSTAPDATEQMYTPEEVRAIEAEVAADPVSVNQAVSDATSKLPPEEVESLINSLDVKTLDELRDAFAKAWTRAKEAGDKDACKAIKGAYDEMRAALEAGQIV